MTAFLVYCYSSANTRYDSAVISMQLVGFVPLVSFFSCGIAILLGVFRVIAWTSVFGVAMLSVAAILVTLVKALPFNA